MPNKTWKQAERRAARLFGAERAALSGSNGKLTASDSTHSEIFLEAKHSKQYAAAIWNLYRATQELARQESKLPVLAVFRKGSPGFLVVVHSDDLYRLASLLPIPTATSYTTEPPKKRKKRATIVRTNRRTGNTLAIPAAVQQIMRKKKNCL